MSSRKTEKKQKDQLLNSYEAEILLNYRIKIYNDNKSSPPKMYLFLS